MNLFFLAQAVAEPPKTKGIKIIITDQMIEKTVDFMPKILAAIVVLFIFYGLLKLVDKIAAAAMKKLKWDKAIEQLLRSIIRFAIMIMGAVTAADQLGINVTSLVAGVGVASLAISFAAKDTLENFIAGVTIIIDKPFKVGDLVEVGGSVGTVTEITLRSVRIMTKENYLKIIPTSKVIGSEVTNRSTMPDRLVYMTIGIGYGSDIDKAREIIMESFQKDDRVVQDPPPSVVVTELADSSVNLRLNFGIKDPSMEWPIQFEYYEKLKKEFDREGIDIPFPCRTIYMEKTEAA